MAPYCPVFAPTSMTQLISSLLRSDLRCPGKKTRRSLFFLRSSTLKPSEFSADLAIRLANWLAIFGNCESLRSNTDNAFKLVGCRPPGEPLNRLATSLSHLDAQLVVSEQANNVF